MAGTGVTLLPVLFDTGLDTYLEIPSPETKNY